MKTILAVDNLDTQQRIERHLKPLGFDFISYQNPVKAIDNLEEIDPDLILFSAEDFPRHWKPFLSHLRSKKNRDDVVFILLTGEKFSDEEAEKATALEINGMIKTGLEEEDILTLQDILARYNLLPEIRGDRRYPAVWMKEIEFAFTHPYNFSMITGEITDISLGGLSFLPDMPHVTADILEGEELEGCSLSVEEDVFTVDAKVVRNNRIMALQYIDLPESTHKYLMEYLNKKRYRKD